MSSATEYKKETSDDTPEPMIMEEIRRYLDKDRKKGRTQYYRDPVTQNWDHNANLVESRIYSGPIHPPRSEVFEKMVSEAQENFEFRMTERMKHNRKREYKNLLTGAASGIAVTIMVYAGYLLTGTFPALIWLAPVLSALMGYTVHKLRLGRFAGALLFLIPGFFTFPLFFIGLFIAGWGGGVGLLSETRYEGF